MNTAVVVEDPLNEFLLGEVAEGNHVRMLSARGAALLPVDLQLRQFNALAGFAHRSFGHGFRFNLTPKHGCSFVLYVATMAPLIYWTAKIVRDVDAERARGMLRLATDTSQRGVVSGGLTHETPSADLSKHGPTELSWFISGQARFTASLEGFLGLSLYGTAEGCSVSWVAATQIVQP